MSKRDAALRVKRSLTFASNELREALGDALDTGDKSLIEKVTDLRKQTTQLKDELEIKLDGKTG